MSERRDKLKRLGRTTHDRRRDRVEAERREAVEILAEIELEQTEAAETVTRLRGLASETGKARAGISGATPGDVGALHRQVKRLGTYPASDNGSLGNVAESPGNDSRVNGPEWLARLRKRLGKVAELERLHGEYCAAMRGAVAAQAESLVGTFRSAVTRAEGDAERLQGEAQRARDVIATCESELDDLADSGGALPATV